MIKVLKGNIVQTTTNFHSSPYLFFLTAMTYERRAKYSVKTQQGGISLSASLLSEWKGNMLIQNCHGSYRSLYLNIHKSSIQFSKLRLFQDISNSLYSFSHTTIFSFLGLGAVFSHFQSSVVSLFLHSTESIY